MLQYLVLATSAKLTISVFFSGPNFIWILVERHFCTENSGAGIAIILQSVSALVFDGGCHEIFKKRPGHSLNRSYRNAYGRLMGMLSQAYQPDVRLPIPGNAL